MPRNKREISNIGEIPDQVRDDKFKKSFSLIEVIVSIAVIVTVITSATGILVTVIRTNSDNLNTLVAYGLAQEGIEGIRMIRDSNFLLGVGFDGIPKESQITNSVWGESLFDSSSLNTSKDLVLEKNLNLQTDCSTSDLQSCLPFSLANYDQAGARIMKTADGIMGQGQAFEIPENLQTPFRRKISITATSADELTVNSEVDWTDNNQQQRSVVLNTILTSWKFKK